MFWIALAALVIASVGGATFAVLRGLRTWRDLKATGSRLRSGLDEISRASAEIETHLTRAGESSERLGTALSRLSRSRGRLDVQLAALREARESVGRAVPFAARR